MLRQRLNLNILERRKRHPCDRMGMENGPDIGTALQNGAVDGQASGVRRRLCAADRCAVEVHFDQAIGLHFMEVHAQLVDEVLVIRPRHAAGNVGRREIRPPLHRAGSVTGCELHARFGFGRRRVPAWLHVIDGSAHDASLPHGSLTSIIA